MAQTTTTSTNSTTTSSVPPSTPTVPTFKIVLIGDGGVGKTTFIKRHLTGEFEKRYIILGPEFNSLVFHTNYGPMRLSTLDIAGQEKFGGLRDGYYVDAEGAIFMFDVTSEQTYKNIGEWIADFKRVVDIKSVPMVICGNKVDLPGSQRVVKHHQISANLINLKKKLEKDIHYYDISAKSNYNFEKPFLYILRQLTKHDDLVLVEAPAIPPPTANQANVTIMTKTTGKHYLGISEIINNNVFLNLYEYKDKDEVLIQQFLKHLSGKLDSGESIIRFKTYQLTDKAIKTIGNIFHAIGYDGFGDSCQISTCELNDNNFKDMKEIIKCDDCTEGLAIDATTGWHYGDYELKCPH